VVENGLIFISSNFGETWSSGATDSRSLGITYGKDATGTGMWVATAGRRDRDVAASAANTMAYSYDGKLWRGIAASAGLSEQAWSVAYGKDGFGVGMWVAGGYDRVCGLKWSYDGVTWNATTGASGASVWAGAAAGRRALCVYWNGSMWLASTSDTRNGEPRGTGIAANNASGVPGYLLYSYNGKNWLPVLAPNTYAAAIGASTQPSVYSVLPNPAILDFGSFYDDQTQRGATITNTTARTVGAVMSSVPIENVNTIIPYGKGSLTTGQVPFLMGGDSGLVDSVIAGSSVTSGLPVTSELAASTTSLSTSTDGGITWRAVPNSTRVMTKVNKILCDESTQQIVAVGTGNYSVATSTPATAGNADGWVGVFGSRMMDTRAGLFEKYGTGATWFGGAKMWIASGRAQSRRGSSLAVSVNGTVWQDAKIVSQMAAGAAGGARGGGLTSRTTGGAVTTITTTPITTTTTTTTTIPNPDVALYSFSTFTFDNAGATGRLGPDLSACRTRYAAQFPTATWTQDTTNKYLDMSTNGIQLWTVPATGSYTISCAGARAGSGGSFTGGYGRIVSGTFILTKGDILKLLVGQMGATYMASPGYTINTAGTGGGGTFVTTFDNTILLIGGGGGGGKNNPTWGGSAVGLDAPQSTSGNGLLGGTNGGGGTPTFNNGDDAGGGGGGYSGNGSGTTKARGIAFLNNGLGGKSFTETVTFDTGGGGFGGGGGTFSNAAVVPGGGGGYSGGSASEYDDDRSAGGGGSFLGTAKSASSTSYGGTNTTHGSVTITPNFTMPPATITTTTTTSTTSSIITTSTSAISFNSSVIPYTAPATPLLTYTDSAAAFSTQVGGVATNSQYNRAVVGGSGVQFVAGGRGGGGSGIAVSNDGQNWSAAAAGTATVFQTPTNVAAYSTSTGSGGFDASFGTVALTQRLTVPATYVSGDWYSVSLSKTGQYQSAVVYAGNIWTSSNFGVTWTERTTGATRSWASVSLSSTGQYQTAVALGATANSSFIWVSSDYGVTWTSRATALNWLSVSISSTGQYQTAVVYTLSANGIWTSSDYGVNWTSRGPILGWWSVSLSSTGQYQTAVVYNIGNIWTSSDFGVSWSERTTGATRNWYSVSLSSTGQYQTAVVYGGNIWTSSDYGVTWSERTTGATRNWYAVSLSSTGQYQSAVVYNGGNIWASSDYGLTWTVRTSPGNMSCRSVSLSSTGQYQTAVAESAGSIFTSTDFGVTWVQRSTATKTNAFTRIKSSASGQYQLATSGPVGNVNGQLYVSSDYGQTWMPRRGLASWLGGAVSATGAVMTAISILPVKRWTFTKLQDGDGVVNFLPIPTNNSISLHFNIRFTTNVTVFDVNINGSWSLSPQITASDIHNLPNPSTIYFSFEPVNGWKIDYTVSGVPKSITIPNRLSITSIDNINNTPSSTFGSNATITGPELPSPLIRSTDYGNTFTDISGTALTGSAYWRAIAMTNSAATQTALAYGSTIYRSSDYGSTWNSTAAVDIVGILTTEFSSAVSPTYAWKSIAMSADAKYQTGVVSGSGQIYVNSNYGREAWTAVDSARNWASVAMSADGKYQSAVVTSGAIYYNSTFGTGTWTAVTSPTGLTWTGIAVSSADGKYQTVVARGDNIRVNSNYGVGTWASKGLALGWSSIAVSSTGRYQTAIDQSNGFIYIDASFGEAASWTQVESQRAWVSVAMSSTGQYQTAVVAGGKIYVNNNYGANGAWTETDSNRAWISVAISSTTGRYQTAVVQNGQIYTNATFGLGTWTAVDSSRNWVSVTISADGKYQSAAVATSGQVYFSRDYGATWSTTAGLDIMGNRWQDVAVAAETGATQVTCVSGGYIYYSGDTGATWLSSIVSIDGVTPQTTNRVWQAVAVSANGQYGLACVNSTSASGFLYRSLNYGASWSSSNISIDGVGTQTTNRPWQDVGMSANGKYQVACLNSNSQTSYTSNIASAVGIMVAPPGALATTFGSSWTQRGQDIDGEAVGDQSGYSVSLSADGTVVAIGAPINYGVNGRESGHVRVYALNAGVWTKRGQDIDGDAGLSSLPMVVSAGGDSGSKSWRSVSMSSTGQYQTVVVTDGNIWTSADYGVSRTERSPGNTTKTWYGISLSSTGQYQTAVVQNGNIWTSYDFGVSWTERTTLSPRSWYSVSISSTGQYQSAVMDSGYIYTSSDFGVSWVNKATDANRRWRSISVSSTGQYQSAVATNNTIYGYIYVSSNFGETWIPKLTDTMRSWGAIAVSSSGQYQTAVGEQGSPMAVYGSTDFGVTWNIIDNLSRSRMKIAMSSTGQYQISPGYSGGYVIFISTDFGVNWRTITPTPTPIADFYGASVSSTGQYQTVCVNVGLIYFSRDYGNTWSTTASYEITTGDQSGFSVSLSANGNTVAVGAPYYDLSGVIDRGQVRVYDFSTNSLWVPRGSNIMVGEGSNDYSGMSMSMSQDGKVVAIGAPFNDGSGNLTDSGHVRVYAWDGSAWAQRGADIDGEFGLTSTNRVVTAAGDSPSKDWISVSMSSTGQYQSAVVMKAISGPPTTSELRGLPEPHSEVRLGCLYLYRQLASIKALWNAL